ncbi:hypothetical protein N7523_008694 [Penicillium sp. IBT 18751x]|nr:hypothetical protein N7523_008694 [Penicillium sp. IBT 18751x]
MNTSTSSSTDKRYFCPVCNQGFTRSDHLKRHGLRRKLPIASPPCSLLCLMPMHRHSLPTYSQKPSSDSGRKLFLCGFYTCSAALAGISPYKSCRTDNHFSFSRDCLRKHLAKCTERGNRRVPPRFQVGRKRHACQRASPNWFSHMPQALLISKRHSAYHGKYGATEISLVLLAMKASTFAVRLATSEVFVRLLINFATGRVLLQQNTHEPPSDQSIIRSLLERGTDSFTENLSLPPSNDRARALACHKLRSVSVNVSASLASAQEEQRDFKAWYNDYKSVSVPCIEDLLNNFFNGPVRDPCSMLDLSLSDETAGPTLATPPGDFSPKLFFEPLPPESERSYAALLTQSILRKAFEVPLPENTQYEVITYLNFLLTTARIERFIDLYFEYWHPSAAIIHPPSFDPGSVSLSLLASVVFMGAMYSQDDMEVYIAKKVIDFAELFTFSNGIFASDSEILIQFCRDRDFLNEYDSCTPLQDLQAGLIMVIAQYWAGSHTSRNRAREERFSQVVKIARQVGLNSRHLLQDRIHEDLWIRKESRIRFVNPGHDSLMFDSEG